MREIRYAYNILVQKSKRKRLLLRTGVDLRIILKCILRKQDKRVVD
jgi:hypothetical protein